MPNEGLKINLSQTRRCSPVAELGVVEVLFVILLYLRELHLKALANPSKTHPEFTTSHCRLCHPPGLRLYYLSPVWAAWPPGCSVASRVTALQSLSSTGATMIRFK